MKGLLLKDFYVAAKHLRSYIALALVFTGVSCVNQENLFFVFYPCLICGMIPVSLLGYDERSKWDAYAMTLPCTRDQVVSAKYLVGLIAGGAVLALVGVVQAARMVVTDTFVLEEYLLLLSMLLVLICVGSSITLPFMFKLGVEKGRVAYYVMVGLVCGGSVIAGKVFTRQMGQQMTLGAMPVLVLVAVGLYALSWYLSIVFYRKREM